MNRPPIRSILAALFALLAPGTPAQDQDWSAKKEEAVRYFQEVFQGRAPSGAQDPGPGQPAQGTAAADSEPIRRLVTDLFQDYEREDVGGFIADLSPTFSSADRTGNDYRFSDMPRALADDFAILDGVRFEGVKVDQPLVQRDGKKIQVDVRWNRRAFVQVGGSEWILSDQRSTFVLEPAADGRMLLGRIFGDAIFGLAQRQGHIVANDGTIDGERIGQPVLLDRTTGVLKPTAGTPDGGGNGGGNGPGPGPTPTPSTTITGTITVAAADLDFDAQSFPPCLSPTPGGTDFEFNCTPNQIQPTGGAGLQVANGGIDTITAAPAGGYSGAGVAPIPVGRAFFFQTGKRNYGAFEVVSFSGTTYTIRYKYQPNGSTDLR